MQRLILGHREYSKSAAANRRKRSLERIPVTTWGLYGPPGPKLRWIGPRRVVALGEANHTNGSFHQAMARLAKYLVEVKNFRVILIETPRLPARTLDQYIHNCSTDADPIDAISSQVSLH